jgi:DNA-directed RNA polymerase I and III subunit RPAC2
VHLQQLHRKNHTATMNDDDAPAIEDYRAEPGDVVMEDEEEDYGGEQYEQQTNQIGGQQEGVDENVFLPDIEIQGGPDESVATFVFHNETHTLGNSLRHILMKNKKVEFCGYTVPHPLEDKMQLRLQTNGHNAAQTLIEGLTDLMSISEHVMNVFNERLDNYIEQE